jgi:hypothetical protein
MRMGPCLGRTHASIHCTFVNSRNSARHESAPDHDLSAVDDGAHGRPCSFYQPLHKNVADLCRSDVEFNGQPAFRSFKDQE